MTRHRLTRSVRGVSSALLGLSILGACGGDAAAPPDDVVSWEIDVGSTSDAGFGARVWLNGEAVYSEAGTTLSRHEVAVVRGYVEGENVVEIEILSANTSPAEYVASCTAEVTPAGRLVHADGVPTSLGVGGRLVLRIDL